MQYLKATLLSFKNAVEVRSELKKIGVHPQGIDWMVNKAIFKAIKLHNIPAHKANIIKQQMLALGGEAPIHSGCIDCSVAASDVILLGTINQLGTLVERLGRQPFKFDQIRQAIQDYLTEPAEGELWKCRDITFDLSKRTHIMGVLNVTPDSFSDGGNYCRADLAIERARQIAQEGADIIDIGGQSTRPGAEAVDAQEELKRIIPVVEAVISDLNLPVSVDTYKAKVAEEGLKKGACIINDVTALRGDSHMAQVVAGHGAGLVLMHMQGTPQTMQLEPHYEDVVQEISEFLNSKIGEAEQAGISRERIIVDPGIGFGKTLEHNLTLLAGLSSLSGAVARPVLIGTSRKSFIGKLLNLPVQERLEGSIATACYAALNGVSVLRVHDVQATKRALTVIEAIKKYDELS